VVWYSGRVKQSERRSNLIYALSCFTLPWLSSSFAPSLLRCCCCVSVSCVRVLCPCVRVWVVATTACCVRSPRTTRAR